MALGARGQQAEASRGEEGGEDTNRSAQSSLGSRKGTQAVATLKTRAGLCVDPAAQRPGVNKQTQGLLGSCIAPVGGLRGPTGRELHQNKIPFRGSG